ncbi:MAG: SpvB/TcaC N-terminal domain-containing protein [Myxococcota bacterium]
MRAMRSALTVSAVGLMLAGPRALAQNGVSDDRVSLPDGPGSIGGVGENVDINPNMGSSSYQVPFRVPAGASEGTTPGLALVYASGQGMGVAGIGWDMSLPTIERMVQKGLPTYTTADHFTADGGNELSYVGDLDGTRVYRQRFEGGFVRYRWWNAGAGTAGYWTAEGPDGTTVYFGADADGQTVASARVQATDGKTFRYHAVEVRDTVGRRMVYTYTKQDGWPLVDEVRYGFGALTTPRFSVRMGYEARTDVVSNATPGYEIRLARRLATVQVLSDATVIRRYQLVYESDAQSGGMTRLARVSELGRDGGKLPIEQSFTYSRTLSGSCVVGCEKPFMVDMGTLPGGVDIQTGRASLIDINGDSLPDVLESDTSGVHKFHLSQLSAEGRPTFSSTVVTSTKTVGGSSFVLSSPGVQLLDVNGGGFTDIVDQVNGKVLCNTGSGDWSGTDCIQHPGDLPTLADDPSDPGSTSDPLGMRFFDYDNDKRIDLLRTPDATSASVSRNTGTGYASVTIDPIGAAFDAENLQLDDINGDGLQDPVMLVSSGSGASLQFKLNLGFGHWQPSWTTLTIDGLGAAEVDGAVLQDLDGDGLSDIVVVSGTTVSYWRNRNAGRFDARQDLVSADIDGQIPERTDAETVVFADMNGNGTDDVVWIGSGGHVRFLELFPVRPNLLSRVENGIGWVRVIEYGTSIAQRARDAGTAGAWTTPLPESMNIVTATDTWVTLTGGEDGAGVHERRELAYHDGFYDGVEKSFRGFEKVEQNLVTDADDLQDPRLEVMEFDVGRDDPAHHGLLLRASVFGGAAADTPMQETTTEWGDCAVDGVASADPAVQFVCERATTVLHQEGASVSEWRRVRTEKTYDGYGNVTELRELGVVSSGADDAPTGCGPCASLPTGLSSGACGAQCLGDERITKTTFVVPGVDTGGAWLVHLPVKLTVQGSDGGALVSEESAFYDGPDFVGLAAGKATKGLLTRVSTRVSASETIDSARSAYTAQGELAASLDPLGKVSDATAHRRDYSYDERGLRPTRVTIHAGDHDLVKDVSYDASWYEASEATAYRVVKDGSDVTPRNSTSITYDEFGRPIAIVRPGDTREAPSQTFTYELGDPVTRIVGLARKTPGGAMDVETVDCLDGRARSVQSLVKIDATHFQADGFRELNSAGRVTRAFQPYMVSSDACPTAPPSAVPFETTRYDALGRDVETLAPDASIYGSASSARTQYGPLSVTLFDQNDTDADSAFVGTPTLRVSDGLDRLVRIERRLAKDGAPDVFTLAYDELGRVARVTDPAGHVKTQELDLLDRVVHSVDPNAGETHMTYDAAGNP